MATKEEVQKQRKRERKREESCGPGKQGKRCSSGKRERKRDESYGSGRGASCNNRGRGAAIREEGLRAYDKAGRGATVNGEEVGGRNEEKERDIL